MSTRRPVLLTEREASMVLSNWWSITRRIDGPMLSEFVADECAVRELLFPFPDVRDIQASAVAACILVRPARRRRR